MTPSQLLLDTLFRLRDTDLVSRSLQYSSSLHTAVLNNEEKQYQKPVAKGMQTLLGPLNLPPVSFRSTERPCSLDLHIGDFCDDST